MFSHIIESKSLQRLGLHWNSDIGQNAMDDGNEDEVRRRDIQVRFQEPALLNRDNSLILQTWTSCYKMKVNKLHRGYLQCQLNKTKYLYAAKSLIRCAGVSIRRSLD